MLKFTIVLERGGQTLSLHLWLLEKYSSYIRISYWKRLNMNMVICMYTLLLLFIAYIYMTNWVNIVSLFDLIDFIDFKTLNVHYSKNTCPIEFKLTGSIVGANKSLYIDFQVILKFYKNIRIFNFKGHRCFLWSSKHVNKLKELWY